MPSTRRRSRWSTDPKLAPDGKPVGFAFTEGDLDICKLLAFSARAREPWSYEYLPTSWFAPLLGRGSHRVPARLRDLSSKPHFYIAKPDQPRSNCRDIIYALASKGVDAVRESGVAVPRLSRHRLAHALMANLIAASFELASHEVAGAVIETAVRLPRLATIPDWRPFRLSAPAGAFTVFIEADMGTETLSANENANTIDGKFVAYLRLTREPALKNPLFVFVTTRRTRRDSMIERLKRVIDRERYEHDSAGHFAFAHIAYDRFLNTVPKPGPWAVSEPYQRAGFTPLNLTNERTNS